MRRMNAGLLLLPLALVLGGCDTFSGNETGSLTILLTDAPGDVLEAWVTIDRIYLQAGQQEPGAGEPGVDLMTGDVSVDLMTLSNDIEGLVQDAEVPTGTYAQLRVVVTGACIAVEGETTTDTEGETSTDTLWYATSGYTNPECGADAGSLVAPSLAETGIKVLLGDGGDGPVTVTGTQQVLLLDFDVSQSFGQASGQAGWVMSPVIRGGEMGLTASITANLTLAQDVTLPEGVTLGSFAAQLREESAEPFVGEADADTFSVTFEYLVPEADVDFVVSVKAPEDGWTYTIEPESVIADVVSGTDTNVNFTITAVTGGAL